MRKIRSLILASFAVAALAVLPSAALASAGSPGVSADSYPATLHGSQSGYLSLRLGAGSTLCYGMTFEGTLAEKSAVATASTVKDPTCNLGIDHLRLNGCKIEIQPSGAGSVGIGPAKCGTPEFSVEGCAGLTLPVPSKIHATYENVGGHIVVNINDNEVEYVSNGAGCKSKGTHTDLAISGSLEVTATNAENKSIGTKVTTGGLYVGGVSEPRLEAAEYPVNVVGERLQAPFVHQIKLLETKDAEGATELKVTCEAAAYSGGELTGASSSLSLTASYSGCSLSGYLSAPVTVDMRSCHYGYSGFEYSEAGEGYFGESEIACSKAGDYIKVTDSEIGCYVKISPQKINAKEARFADMAINGVSGMGAIASGTGVDYTTSYICQLGGFPASGEDGVSESDMWLYGNFPG